MKVWIFNHYAATPNLPGGTRHYDLARELVKRGHRIAVFASSYNHSELREMKKYNNGAFLVEDHNGVKFVWLKTHPYKSNDRNRIFNMLSYSVNAERFYLKCNLDAPDIIIGSSVHLFAAYTARRIAVRMGVPFIVEIRDLWPKTLIDLGKSRLHPFILLLGVLERYLYKKSDKIIVLLPGAAGYISGLGISGDKIVCIPNGVDMNRLRKNRAARKDQGKFEILYAGAVGLANNLDVLVDAADLIKDKIKNIRVRIIGDGPERGRLETESLKRGLRNISFEDPVPKDEIFPILQNADVLFFNLKDAPVFQYGISSNKLFDYMASGVPLLFSAKAGNNPVEEAKAGLSIMPGDSRLLAEAMIRLYHMPKKERDRLGRNGRAYIKEHHSIPKLADKLEYILNELV